MVKTNCWRRLWLVNWFFMISRTKTNQNDGTSFKDKYDFDCSFGYVDIHPKTLKRFLEFVIQSWMRIALKMNLSLIVLSHCCWSWKLCCTEGKNFEIKLFFIQQKIITKTLLTKNFYLLWNIQKQWIFFFFATFIFNSK